MRFSRTEPRACLPMPIRGLTAALLLATTLPLQAADTPARVATAVLPAAPCGRVEIAPVVQVSVGKSTVLRPATPITRVLLGNPDGSRAARPATVKPHDKNDKTAAADEAPAPKEDKLRPGVADVDVVLLGPTEIYVLGRSLGTTNVVLLDQSGRCTAFDVAVSMDTAALQTVFEQFLPEEKGIRVSAAFDSVVLTGLVQDPGSIARAVELANAYVRSGSNASVSGMNPRIVNMLVTGAPQQVMLEVKVAEVSKALLDTFGINFSRAFVSGDSSMAKFLSGIFGGAVGTLGQISGTGPNGVPLSSVGTVVGGVLPGTSGNAFGNVTRQIDSNGNATYTTTYGPLPGRGVTNGALNMQKNDGLVKVLAEPNVMAISGQEGRFNAGGKIFIPVATQNSFGGLAYTLEEKPFGVSLNFKPTVLDAGRINLQLMAEVSELNRDGVTLTAGDGKTILPSFSSRSAQTTVQLQDGQSFAVGGLIKNNTTANVTAFPILGELPVIGALFRSTEFQSDKSELVFVITPRLVKPLPANYTLPTDRYVEPTREDLILRGRLEGQRPEAPPAAGFEVK